MKDTAANWIGVTKLLKEAAVPALSNSPNNDEEPSPASSSSESPRDERFLRRDGKQDVSPDLGDLLPAGKFFWPGGVPAGSSQNSDSESSPNSGGENRLDQLLGRRSQKRPRTIDKDPYRAKRRKAVEFDTVSRNYPV